MRISLFFAALLITQCCQAQYSNVWKDPDIIWAAEIDTYVPLFVDTANIDRNSDDKAVNFSRKALPQWLKGKWYTRRDGQPEISLGQEILEAVQSGAWPAYEDNQLRVRMDKTEVWRRTHMRDSITVYDPVTRLPKNVAIENDLDGNTLQGFFVRQLVFYNDKTGYFGQITHAIQPRYLWDIGGEQLECRPFWLESGGNSSKEKWPHLDARQVEIAFRSTTDLDRAIEFEKTPPLKNYKPPVLDQFFEKAQQNQKKWIFQDRIGSVLADSFFNNLFFWRDTVLTFDSETFEEKTLILEEHLDAKKCPSLLLEEDWYWDTRRKRLFIRLNRFAPVRLYNYGYFVPVFWVKLSEK